MPRTRSGVAALAVICLATLGAAPALAQSGDPLGVGRKMLAEDNPGELWIEKGKALFYQKRGPKNTSLEQCDFGMGPGRLEGAAARLPRYFTDVDRVQDLETRLISCMVRLQGFSEADVVKRAISPGGSSGSDVEALALYITSRSNGMKVNVQLSHQKEYDSYKAGEYLFFRRSGQTDFSCTQCHGEANKRIRLQDLVHMTSKQGAEEVASTWPAYRGAHYVVRTMQWRLTDCFWQMRLPDMKYGSDMSIALTLYLNYQGNGALIRVPGFKR
ncbi:MAG: sulfur oxidation c-type cytochrome SoxA [Betaproteobacteria bacterium]|nr:sulfur oxidation c-type cytochrome SoxA [Betaproteobacteria bacterium]